MSTIRKTAKVVNDHGKPNAKTTPQPVDVTKWENLFGQWGDVKNQGLHAGIADFGVDDVLAIAIPRDHPGAAKVTVVLRTESGSTEGFAPGVPQAAHVAMCVSTTAGDFERPVTPGARGERDELQPGSSLPSLDDGREGNGTDISSQPLVYLNIKLSKVFKDLLAKHPQVKSGFLGFIVGITHAK